jgi:hypothetical protein
MSEAGSINTSWSLKVTTENGAWCFQADELDLQLERAAFPRSNGGGPRREREDRPERNDGPEPEFVPAFLTRDDD